MSMSTQLAQLTVSNLASKQAHEEEEARSDVETDSSLSTIKVVERDSGSSCVAGGSRGSATDGEELGLRPGLIRKKSGELIKSSLKLSGLARSVSASQLGGNKSVRFASRLANVKMFDGKESPSTVSTAENTPMSSPQTENDHGAKGYFDFKWDDEISDITSDTSSEDEMHEYVRVLRYSIGELDFKPAKNIYDRQHKACYLQSIKLSPERNALVGLIMAKNITFEKRLSIKLTFNNWESSVIMNNITYCKSFQSINFDQFTFVIPLENLPRTVKVQFVIRYDVAGNSYWDNNNAKNYNLTLKPFESGKSGIKTYNYNFKNTVPQFDELVTRLASYQKSDHDEIYKHNDYDYSRKSSTRTKSDLHNRYNINDNLDEPRSNPFSTSTPTITVDSPSSAGNAAIQRPYLKSSFSTSDISKVRPKYSQSYKSKQMAAPETDSTNFNSQFYTNLLQSYCFNNGDNTSSAPTTPYYNSTNSFSNSSTASTLQSYSDSIYT